ncbi:HIT domain-containing protein [Parvularcula dongshanensis]|uniref:Diadenosine tetraphosphate (Ap4A) HIT family hydrolase n=1 Tax=Parvularcula dongshanensis TaxID=1173995 RepID=A0A840HYN8_9PROT|nr:HIT family protein [Parvularcula dongshanensis]MBB4657689.1 diadenosine tetraphosphate (Ap4A) HIT family hydrolase [Parvularcula dongshanensis]
MKIDPRLAEEGAATADLPLCRVLLRNEARFPWLVLVPRRVGVREVMDLLPGDRAAFWRDVERAGDALLAATGAAKLNVALFGNMVPQLHAHLVARSPGDAAWPGSAVGLPREAYASPPAFWPDLLSRLALSERQRP